MFDFGQLFHDSLVSSLINGFVLFWNSGGWYLAVMALAGALVGVLTRKRRRRRF